MGKGNKKVQIRAFIYTAIFCVIFCAILCGIFFSPQIESRKLGAAASEKGVFDITKVNKDIGNQVLAYGMWEFYYNSWIVTDKITRAPDDYIQLNTLWTTLKKGYDNKGFASYKIRLTGLEQGDKLIFLSEYYIGGVKIFINGDDHYSCGAMSKCATCGAVGAVFSTNKQYVATDSQPVEVVVELSYTEDACFNQPLIFKLGEIEASSVVHFSFEDAILAILFAVLIVCSVIGLMTKKDLFFMLLVFLMILQYSYEDSLLNYFLESLATKRQLGVLLFDVGKLLLDYYSAVGLSIPITVMLVLLVCSRNICGFQIKLPGVIIITVSTILYLVGIIGGTGHIWAYLSVVGILMIYVFLLYQYFVCFAQKKKYSISMFALGLLIVADAVFYLLDYIGSYLETSPFLVHVKVFCVMILILIIYFRRLNDSYQYAFKSMRAENEMRDIKALALRKQITPHFIFNVMATIQYLFHHDFNVGEEALKKFKKHLNLNIEANQHMLVPLDDEIKNIENYFALENMRFGNKFKLEIDIKYSDIKVPILCLQPLIENCIKHADLQDKEDGKIKLTCKKEGDMVEIVVADNGCGFVMSKNKASSVGLKNVSERMRLTLGATTKIVSEPNEGTAVIINIPQGKNAFKAVEL